MLVVGGGRTVRAAGATGASVAPHAHADTCVPCSMLFGHTQIEYHVVKFDEESKTCTVAVVATDVIKRLHEMDEKTYARGRACCWVVPGLGVA